MDPRFLETMDDAEARAFDAAVGSLTKLQLIQAARQRAEIG
jgi:hypothetical protein